MVVITLSGCKQSLCDRVTKRLRQGVQPVPLPAAYGAYSGIDMPCRGTGGLYSER
jgi:hypothetical protein